VDAGGDTDRNFRIFKTEKVVTSNKNEKSLFSSVINGINTSREYLSLINDGSGLRSMTRLDGLFSDGINLMSVNIQLLSNATDIAGLNVNYIGGAGNLLIKTLASTPSIMGKIYRGGDDVLLLKESIKQENGIASRLDNNNQVYTSNPVVDTSIIEDTSFSPLLRFIRRRMPWNKEREGTSGTSEGSRSVSNAMINVIPVVRLVPRVTSWLADRSNKGVGTASTSKMIKNILPPSVSAPSKQTKQMMSTSSPDMRAYLTSVSSPRSKEVDHLNVLPVLPKAPSSISAANPTPSKADMALIKITRISAAVKSALAISNFAQFAEFMRSIGLKPLLAALLRPPPDRPELRLNAVRALRLLVKYDSNVIPSILSKERVLETLNDMMDEPFSNYGLGVFRSASEKAARAEVIFMPSITKFTFIMFSS
jgi:hypothetical protein